MNVLVTGSKGYIGTVLMQNWTEITINVKD